MNENNENGAEQLPHQNSIVDVDQQPGLETTALVERSVLDQEEYNNHVLNQVHQVSFLFQIPYSFTLYHYPRTSNRIPIAKLLNLGLLDSRQPRGR